MKRRFEQKIRIVPTMGEQQIEIAINFARLLGFHSIQAQFPIAGLDGDLEVPSSQSALAAYFQYEDEVEHPDFVRSVPPMDYKEYPAERRAIGLESLFATGRILPDRDHDFLPDAIDLKFALPQNPSATMIIAACNLAFRLGMETTEFQGSMMADANYEGNLLVFEEAEQCTLSIWSGVRSEEEPIQIVLSGSGTELEAFSAALCNQVRSAQDAGSLSESLRNLQETIRLENTVGQLAYALSQGATDQELFLETRKSDLNTERLYKKYPNLKLRSYREKRLEHTERFALSWEVDALRALTDELLAEVEPEDQVRLDIAVSESRQVRERIQKELEQKIAHKGAHADVRVLCTFKKGFSWLTEDILARAKAKNTTVSKIEIGFKDFLPEGASAFVEEDGAIPTYGADRSKLGKWLDLPIRPLQELYPALDILCKELRVEKERVELYKLPIDAAENYRVMLFAQDTLLLDEVLNMDTSERNYLEDYPEMGLVHPSTGSLRATITNEKGSHSVDRRIESDTEKIWDVFQSRILPSLKQYLLKKNNNHLPEEQPYFAELRLEIGASEPNERLGNREDLISSLDALHEDLYFTAIEYLKCVGLELSGVAVDAPGLIYPRIIERASAPSVAFEIWDFESDRPLIRGTHADQPIPKAEHAICYLESLLWEGERLVPVIRVEGAEEILSHYVELLKDEVVEPLFDSARVIYQSSDQRFEVCSATEKPIQDLTIDQIDIPKEELIGYPMYLDIIKQLERVKGLKVSHIASSFEGRRIYAVELADSFDGYTARTKKLSLYPSLMINARHHANEVSSTNAAFDLIARLLTEPAYSDLAQRMTIGIIPMENVDGTEIHDALQQENPNWILHTARFNAVGREFGRDYFNPKAVSTEAMAQTRLWERLLPDVYVDNHGVPSHEWVQPFSGYTAPAYKGFWLPRSVLYGYFWNVGKDYPQNIPLNKKMEEIIADRIEQDAEISGLNRDWMWQFEAYAHRWMPKQYPANYYREMINYWIEFPYQADHKYFSVRFPWITTVGYTSEVADETAHGSYLALCARAHLTHDLATIDMVQDAKSVYQQEYRFGEVEHAVLRRERPLSVL